MFYVLSWCETLFGWEIGSIGMSFAVGLTFLGVMVTTVLLSDEDHDQEKAMDETSPNSTPNSMINQALRLLAILVPTVLVACVIGSAIGSVITRVDAVVVSWVVAKFNVQSPLALIALSALGFVGIILLATALPSELPLVVGQMLRGVIEKLMSLRGE